MSIAYIEKEMILDCTKADQRLMFIDINAQGILELDVVGRRLLSEFPDVALKYRAACVQGLFDPGSLRYYEDNGYDMILGCTTFYRIGDKMKDASEAIERNTIMMIDRIAREYSGRKIVSGILNRHTNTWGEVSKAIIKSGLDWSVYRE